MSCIRWWAPVLPKVRSMRPTSSNRPCRAARCSALAQPRRASSASRSKRIARSNVVSRPSRCRRRMRPTPSRSSWASRIAMRSFTRSATPMTRSSSPFRTRTATSRIVFCPTRPSTSSMRPARASSSARPRCPMRSPRCRSGSSSSSTGWIRRLPTMSSKRRASIPTRSARSARHYARCAKSITSTTRPRALWAARTLRMWFRAGPACR